MQDNYTTVTTTTDIEDVVIEGNSINDKEFVTTGYVEVTDGEEISMSEKELSMDDIHRLSRYINTQGAKEALNNELEKVNSAKDELLGSLAGMSSDKDFIQKRLDEFNTLEELQVYLKSDENVTNFYINEENDETIELAINIEDPKRAMDFKRELLIYMKTTDIAHAAIDKEYEELDKATSEMEADIKEACIQLSDNVLAYTSLLKDKANVCEDEVMKKEILTSAKYIESGYTFEVLNDILEEYPSVARNTVKELITQNGIDKTGKRYMDKIKRYDVKVSLIPLVSNGTDVKSIEEFVLIRDDEYKLPDLFIYSTIRFFSMANWEDNNIRRFHASIALVMKRLIGNQLSDDVKETVLTNMIKYLAKFEQYIK